jgi:hypothetical protein
MSYTNFPKGITSFGMPVMGMPFGMKAESKIWFVDQEDGSDGNTGLEPSRAFKYISTAVSNATNYDVIYMLAQGYTRTDDPTPFRELTGTGNISVPYAKDNLAFIGAGHLGFRNRPIAPQIKGETPATTAVVRVKAPFVHFENLAFNRGASTTGGIYAKNEGDGTDEAMGLSIYNCYFRNLRGAGATNGGAVYVEGLWQSTISRCFFHNCRVGVYAISGTRTLTELLIENCNFGASADSNISADIYIASQGTSDWIVRDCTFNHGLPSYSGGALYYVQSTNTADVGMVTGCTLAHTGPLTTGAAGTGFRHASADVGGGWNYCDSALMAAAE